MKNLHLLINFIDFQGMFVFGSWHAMLFSQGVKWELLSQQTNRKKPSRMMGWKTLEMVPYFFWGDIRSFSVNCFELMEVTQKTQLPATQSFAHLGSFLEEFMACLAPAWCGTKPRIRSGSCKLARPCRAHCGVIAPLSIVFQLRRSVVTRHQEVVRSCFHADGCSLRRRRAGWRQQFLPPLFSDT